MPKRVSTVLGREFGDSLRAVIARTGLLESQLAKRVGWEHAKLSDLVNGKGGVNLEEFMFLLGFCQTPSDEMKYLRSLYLEAREKGWLQLFEEALPPHVRTLIHHERIATEIVQWSSLYMPGLLQLEPYARAVAEDCGFIPKKDIPAWVAARMERRELVDNTKTFVFYVYEPVLTSRVGSADILRAQLHELLRMLIRPYISVRIVPAGKALTGDFTLLNFKKYEPVVYQGGLNSALFLDDKVSVGFYQQALNTLDRVAFGEAESKELITCMVS